MDDVFKTNIYRFWARYLQTQDTGWLGDIWRLLSDNYPSVKFEKVHPNKGDAAVRLPSLKEEGKFVRFSFIKNELSMENVDKLVKMFERRGNSKAFDDSEIEARKKSEKNECRIMKSKITESQLTQIVMESVKSILKENFFDDMYNGYKTLEGNPETVEDVFKGDGWKIVTSKQMPDGSMLYGVTRALGAFGSFNGIEAEDMVEELNIVLEKEGKHAEYKGTSKKYSYIELFLVK